VEWAAAHHWFLLVMSNNFDDFNRALVNDLRAHGGRASSGPFQGADVVILTTKGAKSGDARENPLVYTHDGKDYVVVASKGGAPTNPAWYHNLVAHPEVTVEVLGEKFKARAHATDGDEYERLFAQHAGLYPTFHEYRKKTNRKIPVIVLKRVA
jgi:deazaflavin-dependent oxidoreductase (nitroreductase family)